MTAQAEGGMPVHRGSMAARSWRHVQVIRGSVTRRGIEVAKRQGGLR